MGAEPASHSEFRCRFWFPNATKVRVVFDEETFQLRSEDGQRWETTVLVEKGIKAYRFVVDDIWSFPDPYNAAYTIREGVYFSVLNTDTGAVSSFPEEPQALFVTDRLSETAFMFPVASFGPANEFIHAILQVGGLARAHNHLAWLWLAPTGHMAVRAHITSGSADTFFASETLSSFFEPGVWRLSAFLNGRFCGEASFRVKPVGYGNTTVRRFSITG